MFSSRQKTLKIIHQLGDVVPTSLFDCCTYGSQNLSLTSQKDFCNNIGTNRTGWAGLAMLNKGTLAQRNILKLMAASGGIGLSAARTFRSGVAHAADAPAYDPGARFDLAVSEVELRRNSARRVLMARTYQPKGPGSFPTVLDLHGGAWNGKNRFAEEPMDRALAASGLLVVLST